MTLEVREPFSALEGEKVLLSQHRAEDMVENGGSVNHLEKLEAQGDRVAFQVVRTITVRPGDQIVIEDNGRQVQLLEEGLVGKPEEDTAMGEPERAIQDKRETATAPEQSSQESGKNGGEESDDQEETEDSNEDLPPGVEQNGSWYIFPDGEKVQGKKNAIQYAEEEFS